jgi:hypothetical protein
VVARVHQLQFVFDVALLRLRRKRHEVALTDKKIKKL